MNNSVIGDRTVKTVTKQLRSSPIRNYKKGARRLYITMMDGENSYDPNGVWVDGLIEVSLTLTSEITSINADNNPNYLPLTAPTTGTGTIKVLGMPIDALKYIANVEVTDNGVIYGSDIELPRCAFRYEELASDKNGASIDIIAMFDCTLAMPSASSKSDDGKSVKECTINITLNPVFYMDNNGNEKRVTVFTTNSNRNPKTYEKFKDSIPFPCYELLNEVVVEPPQENKL